MATLIEAALKVVKRVCPVYYGTATDGTDTTLVDSANAEQPRFWDGGLMWLLSGDNAGKWIEILTYGNNIFTFRESIGADDIAAGDKYAVITSEWKRNLLRDAVNEACKNVGKIYTYDDTLTIVENQEEYELPTGVFDVRDVEIATNSTSPYTWVQHNYWRERDGILVFHIDHLPDVEDNLIRVWYATTHPDLDDDDELYWTIDDIQWSAVLYLLQQDMVKMGFDHIWLKEMMNKAEIENMAVLRNIKRPPPVNSGLWGGWF